MKTGRDFIQARQRAVVNLGVLLKGPRTNSLANSYPKLQQRDSGLKSNFRASTGGAALPRKKVLTGNIVPLLSPPSTQPTGAGRC